VRDEARSAIVTKSVFTKRYERLRLLLVEARRSSRLSQAELAAKLRRPQSFVSKYERGERRLDVIEFLEIAEVLELDGGAILAKL
jgi:transcriptional regulator with XRE-family HTH domain